MQFEEKFSEWHERHTFTCFAFQTFSQEDCKRIGEVMQKVKVALLNTGIN